MQNPAYGLLALLIFSAACGGDDDTPARADANVGERADAGAEADASTDAGTFACDFAACGGDPVGAWTIVSSCAVHDFATAECPDRSGEVAYDASGSLTFGADMMLSGSITLAGVSTSHTPLSCLQAGTSCASLTDPGDGVECSEDGDRCACRHPFFDPPFELAGTWATTRSTLTLGELGVADYCVVGDTLSLRINMNDGPLGFELTR